MQNENTGRVLVLALAAWWIFAASGAAQIPAIGAFAAAYALLTYLADRRVRDYLLRLEPRLAWGLAIGVDAAVPFAPAMLGPAAVLITLAAIEIALKRRLRSARATSPGARPAAT